MKKTILLWMVIVISLAVGVNAVTTLESLKTPIAYYPMNDNTTGLGGGGTDSSDNKINLTWNGGNNADSGWTTGAECFVGNCTEFNGDDASDWFVDNGSNTLIDTAMTGTSISFCAWAKAETNTDTSNDVIGKLSQFILRTKALLGAWIYDGGYSNAEAGYGLGSGTGWNHLCGTYDGSNIVLYRNNTVEANTSVSTSITTSADDFTIGVLSTGSNSYFTGWIDEVVLYNKTLNGTEIQNLYDLGVAGEEINLTATAEAGDTTDPVSTLLTPANGTSSATTNWLLTANVTDETTLFNVSLIINGVYNETNSTGLINGTYSFNKTFAIGSYSWTIEGCDNSSNCFTPANYSLEITGAAATVENYPSSLNISRGTGNNGLLNTTQYDDDTLFNVSEVVGTPGMTISFNFTDWTPFNRLYIEDYYNGVGGHNIQIYLENTSGNMVSLGTIPQNTSLATHVYTIDDYTAYNNSGTIIGMINHTSPGNVNHWLAIDYINLTNITIHTDAPNISTNATNLDLVEITNVFFEVNASDDLAINNVSMFVDTQEFVNISGFNGTYIFNYTFDTNGAYSIYFQACDTANNCNTTGTYNITMAIPVNTTAEVNNCILTGRYTNGTICAAGGFRQMGGSISISLFLFLITGAVFALSFKREYTNNWFTNLIIRRGFMAVGLYLLTFTSAIMASISSTTGLGLNQEMFFFMNIFSWGGYAALIFLFFKTVVDAMKMNKEMLLSKRMGDSE